MSPHVTEVAGAETGARSSGGNALDAFIDFYRAFNAGDLDALAANWAEGDVPSMDNQIGGIRRGWPATMGISETVQRACDHTSGIL